MNLSPRNKLILVAVGLFALVAALVVLLVMPQFTKIADMEARISEADQRAEQARALLSRRQEAKANAAVTDAALLQLTAAVPETPDLPSLLIEFQDLAYESNMILVAVSPSEIVDSEAGFLVIPMRLDAMGSWADCVEFVQSLGAFPRQVRIVRVGSDLASESDIEGRLDPYSVRVNIDIETYVIPAASAASTAPAAPAPAQ